MQTESYTIPVERTEDFKKKLDAIIRKAEKLGGLVGYKLSDVREETRRGFWTDPATGKQHTYTYVVQLRDVEVWGETPVIEGWQVVAVIDHTPALAGSPFNIVHALGATPKDIEKFKTTQNDCEHCGYDRQRKTTVAIKHETTREEKQVGLGCLGDFTGSHDPHAAARLCEYLKEALSGGGSWGHGEPVIAKTDFLEHVASSIRIHGWTPKSRASKSNPATADRAKERLFNRRLAIHTLEREGARDEDRQRALETLQLIDGLVDDEDRELTEKALEWLEFEANTTNDFIGKLYAALAGQSLVIKHAGIAAALFTAYTRATSRSSVPAEEVKQESGWVGVEGERDEFIVTVTGKRTYEKRAYSYYDSTIGQLVSLTTDEGDVLKWFTTPGGTAGDLEEGKRFRVAATVKSHGEYRGVKETTVNRVHIKEELS